MLFFFAPGDEVYSVSLPWPVDRSPLHLSSCTAHSVGLGVTYSGLRVSKDDVIEQHGINQGERQK